MAANRRSFIIRIWQTGDGDVIGQISDPQEGWRHPFADAAELWRVLTAQAARLSPRNASPEDTPGTINSKQEGIS